MCRRAGRRRRAARCGRPGRPTVADTDGSRSGGRWGNAPCAGAPAAAAFSGAARRPAGAARSGPLLLGLGGDAATPVLLDLSGSTGCFLVAGPPRAGRTTLLRSLLRQACGRGSRSQSPRRRGSALVADAVHAPLPLSGLTMRPSDVHTRLDPATLSSWTTASRSWTAPQATHSLDSLAPSAGAPCWSRPGAATNWPPAIAASAAYVRRDNCGVLLRPGPVDGELLGTRLPRRPSSGPPGRGVVIGLPPPNTGNGDTGGPLAIQIALAPEETPAHWSPSPAVGALAAQPMCGYR